MAAITEGLNVIYEITKLLDMLKLIVVSKSWRKILLDSGENECMASDEETIPMAESATALKAYGWF
jgi:hypothetical protein